MPVVIPKPPQPMKPADLSPQPAPGLTRAEVEAMLAERDAAWERRLAELAITLAPKPQPVPKRHGASISFKRNTKGEITGADIVPQG